MAPSLSFLWTAGQYATVLFGTGYLAVCGALIGFQRKLIWMRPKEVARPRSGALRILPAVDNSSAPTAMLHIPAMAPNKPTLVHFHGNSDQIGRGPDWIGGKLSKSYGLGFVAVEYPSYGYATPGRISAKAACDTAQRALE